MIGGPCANSRLCLLGQLTVPLPPYLRAEYDESTKKVSVSVNDAAEKHQRAMWGEYFTSINYNTNSNRKKESAQTRE